MALFESAATLVSLDLSPVCRLCLENNENNVDVIGDYEQKFETSLQELVWKLFGFWVRPEDELPKKICPNCFQSIHTFHVFASKVKETQAKIQDIMSSKILPPVKSFHVLKNTDEGIPVAVQEKTKTSEMDDMCVYQTAELNPEQYETYSDSNITHANDPWNFLNDASNFVPIETAAKYCPPNSHQHSVEIKVEVDAATVEQLASCGNTRVTKNVILENKSLQARKIKTRSTAAKKSVTIPKANPGSKINKLIKVERLREVVETYDDDRNDSTSDSETNSDSNEPLKKLRVRHTADRKKNWTERSKQRSKLTEQLAEFYNFKCLECLDEKKFPTYHQLNLHCKKHHNLKGYVICCNQKLQDKNVIKSHMLKHLSPGIFQCQECGKELANKESLENHLVKHLPEEKRPFKCAACGRGFPSKGGLTAHEKSHLPEDERLRYVCDVCGKRFPYQTSLNSHKKYVHLNLRTVMCHICPKTFVDKASLNSHIHTHLTNERVQCAECGKWFKNQINLRAHMKTHEGLVFSCPKCTKVFSTKHRLGEHIRGHTDARPHQCSICSKSFKVRAGLKTHLVQHTGEKPYQCPYCPRTFASSGNFSTHKKRMHGSQKPQTTGVGVDDYNSVAQLGIHMDNQVSQQLGLIHCHDAS